jgi:hypothetical protein
MPKSANETSASWVSGARATTVVESTTNCESCPPQSSAKKPGYHGGEFPRRSLRLHTGGVPTLGPQNARLVFGRAA